MIELKDIYPKVGIKLAMQDFDFATPKEKKQLVDKNIKTYLIEKINEINETETFEDTENAISVEELVTKLGELIPANSHFDTLRHLTHFILNIAGEMQNHSIVWYSESEPEFIDNPQVEFGISGKWESLITHEKYSYVQTFHQVYGVFKEVFMTKNKATQLTKRTQQLLDSNK